MKLPLNLLFLLLLPVCTALPVQAADWKGKVDTVDGVAHVLNPAEPSSEKLILEPERLWSFGEESGEDDVLIGAITQALVDGDGNSYFLDSQMSQVIVCDSEGRFVRTIGRSGEGPGEFKTPTTMGLLPGGRLGVVQIMPARVAVFTLDGEPLEDFPAAAAAGFASVQEIAGAGPSVLVALQSTSFDSQKIILTGKLLCLDEDGKNKATLWEKSYDQNIGHLVIGGESNAVLPVWAASGEGDVFISPAYDEYRIDVKDLAGRTLRVIERGYESRKRTEEELSNRRKILERMPAGVGNFEIKIEETDRDIENLLARNNGELWVTSSRAKDEAEEGVLGPFEVFDPEGRYVRNVWIAADFNSNKDVFFIRKNHLYVVERGSGAIRNAFAGIAGGAGMDLSDLFGEEEEDEDDLLPPVVVCYRLGYATGE